MTDVIGGICLGVAVACLSWLVFDTYAQSRQRKRLALHIGYSVIVVALMIYGLVKFSEEWGSCRV